MIHCLIVDDESPAIELMKRHISFMDNMVLVGFCNSAVEAFGILKTKKIDLMFLDIEMPILNGLDFLKSLKNPPKVIITTAYRKYAIDGYDLDVVDYLLKPIEFSRFVKAIDRYHDRIPLSVTNVQESAELEIDQSHFYVNINRKNFKIIYKDILFVESLKDYVRIHTDNDKIVVKSNLGKIYESLPKSMFLRTHRSFAIAIDRISAYSQKDIEIGGNNIPIGPSYTREVLSILAAR